MSQLLTSLVVQAALLTPCPEGGAAYRGGTCEDHRAIAALRARYAVASWSGDARALADLWTDDVVTLRAGEPPLRGRDANAASLARALAAHRPAEIADCPVDVEEVVIAGDIAYEWGTCLARLRPAAGAEVGEPPGHLMRILARQPDGDWKIARTISVPPLSAAPRPASAGRSPAEPALPDLVPVLPRLLTGVAPCIEP